MRIALPIWESRISPVFDTAGSLLVVEVSDTEEVGRTEERLNEPFPPQRAARLVQLGVDVLICGAISRPLLCMVTGYGIQVVPFVSGDADEILSAYLSGRLRGPDFPPQFRMPGCGVGRRRFRRRGRRWR